MWYRRTEICWKQSEKKRNELVESLSQYERRISLNQMWTVIERRVERNWDKYIYYLETKHRTQHKYVGSYWNSQAQYTGRLSTTTRRRHRPPLLVTKNHLSCSVGDIALLCRRRSVLTAPQGVIDIFFILWLMLNSKKRGFDVRLKINTVTKFELI